MEPGYRSERTGMCLQRSWIHQNHTGFQVTEKLDENTRYLVGEDNFRKVDIETCE